ncbi:ER-golgi intermediate compartment protein, putative [Bodo saltans]|uniref:ER-golgi intermediate compartment protein, putative n=1 Tax=Bodo saltans TaxID=75058 RepID=A0A0S4KG93_BODSA|nr:ER-golgi intermediate compartment protein, putative [Bodo saltans]|eukprot:CUI14626.1 ER-golgi intermediate compartment protein, putative [Bodo saltans]
MLKQALRFDVFRIVQDRERHLTPATSEGAVVSAVTLVLMALLILYETVCFFQADIRSSMTVDSNSFHKEPVNFNITFTKIPCPHMVVEIFDPQTGARIPELSNSIEVEYSRVLQESPSVVIGQYHPNMGMLNLNPNAPLEGCRMAGSHFLVNVCAVVGGVYTVMGFVATWLESVTKRVAPAVKRMRGAAKKDSN